MTGLVIDMIAEDAVLDHRLLRVEIHQPVGLVVADASVARHQRHGAGEAAGRDVPLHQFAHALQPFGGEADIFRLRCRRCGGERLDDYQSTAVINAATTARAVFNMLSPLPVFRLRS